jgi:hypothetical protein
VPHQRHARTVDAEFVRAREKRGDAARSIARHLDDPHFGHHAEIESGKVAPFAARERRLLVV